MSSVSVSPPLPLFLLVGVTESRSGGYEEPVYVFVLRDSSVYRGCDPLLWDSETVLSFLDCLRNCPLLFRLWVVIDYKRRCCLLLLLMGYRTLSRTSVFCLFGLLFLLSKSLPSLLPRVTVYFINSGVGLRLGPPSVSVPSRCVDYTLKLLKELPTCYFGYKVFVRLLSCLQSRCVFLNFNGNNKWVDINM